MNNEPHSRHTFLSYREVVEMAVDHCHRIERSLAVVRGTTPDERTHLLLQPLGEYQQKLARTLEAHLDNAPKALLDTRCQALPDIDLNADSDQLQGKALSEMAAQVLQWNARLAQLFYGVAATTEVPHLKEMATTLGDTVSEKLKQMSRTIDDSEDM